jgi:hypothetical protein
MGDFNAHINQIAGNRDSVLMRIHLTRDEDGTVKLVENNYIPFYTYTSLNKVGYVTVPLNSTLNGGLSLYRGTKFYQRIVSEIGSKITEFTGDLNARISVQSDETESESENSKEMKTDEQTLEEEEKAEEQYSSLSDTDSTEEAEQEGELSEEEITTQTTDETLMDETSEELEEITEETSQE